MDNPLVCTRAYKNRNTEIIKCGKVLIVIGKSGRIKIGPLEKEKNNQIISKNMC